MSIVISMRLTRDAVLVNDAPAPIALAGPAFARSIAARKLLASDVARDLELLRDIHALATQAAHAEEPKVGRLLDELGKIATAAAPVSPKVIVFSTYADTIRDPHERLSDALAQADALTVVVTHGGPALGDRLIEVAKRLQTVPSAKARKAMRAALRSSDDPKACSTSSASSPPRRSSRCRRSTSRRSALSPGWR